MFVTNPTLTKSLHKLKINRSWSKTELSWRLVRGHIDTRALQPPGYVTQEPIDRRTFDIESKGCSHRGNARSSWSLHKFRKRKCRGQRPPNTVRNCRARHELAWRATSMSASSLARHDHVTWLAVPHMSLIACCNQLNSFVHVLYVRTLINIKVKLSP
jgi:hypothetical protein